MVSKGGPFASEAAVGGPANSRQVQINDVETSAWDDEGGMDGEKGFDSNGESCSDEGSASSGGAVSPRKETKAPLQQQK